MVQVPIKQRIVPAVIIDIHTSIPHGSFTIRPAHALIATPLDDHYYSFITYLAHYYVMDPVVLIRRLHIFVQHKKSSPELIHYPQETMLQHQLLTGEQQQIVD